MAYTKNYYHILGLEAPRSWGHGQGSKEHKHIPAIEIRRAYKIALLAAHPDKRGRAGAAAAAATGKEKAGGGRVYTIDDVKEAYSILAEHKSKAEYDEWMVRNGGALRTYSTVGLGKQEEPSLSSDFILGLELLDLSDFDLAPATTTIVVVDSSSSSSSGGGGGGRGGDEAEEAAKMQWTRPCRCGAAMGVRISEEELEDAESRGEKEVLVGCEGCSLWVRVGFDVEEG